MELYLSLLQHYGEIHICISPSFYFCLPGVGTGLMTSRAMSNLSMMSPLGMDDADDFPPGVNPSAGKWRHLVLNAETNPKAALAVS